MTTYNNQKAWRQVQDFLPETLHFTSQNKPKEEIWPWHGHQVHLDTFRNPKAIAKVICFHGVGTNGRQISMIIGGPLAREGFETIVVDMPTYGVSKVDPKQTVIYDDWVACGSDLVDAELAKDDRPIFLYGLSAGGMETYHVAARNKSKRIHGIIGMTFLDQRRTDVRLETTSNAFWGHLGIGLTALSCRLGLGRCKIKMSIPSKMRTLVNDPDCLKIMLKDETSAGNKVTFAFIDSYMNYKPEMEPQDFDVCPILLTQPEDDRWTPQHLSDPFLDQISHVPVKKTILRHGSHYPIETEALEDLRTNIVAFINENLKS